MASIYEFAPAKLNLYLHITGRRGDGYHDLDSLVAFASVGDQLRLDPAEGFTFHLEGPQAKELAGEDQGSNLVVKVAQSLAELAGRPLDFSLTLVKNLPVASGIGGGSSDAAAALRAVARYWKLPHNDPRLKEVASKHGQDVAVCLSIKNNYIAPEGTQPAPALPHLDCVLVNPGKALSTPSVYRAYRGGTAAFSPVARLEAPPATGEALAAELRLRGNDLYEPAKALMPEIGTILAALEASQPLFAAMSGSGATCFALYPDRAAARNASSALLSAHPEWWIAQGSLPFTRDPRSETNF